MSAEMQWPAGHGLARDDGSGSGRREAGRPPPASVGLWFFIAVGTSLFSLFVVACAMRMDAPDWHRIALPWQVWPATGLLVAGSAAMARAAGLARRAPGTLVPAFRALRCGGLLALAFVLFQLWGWQALIAAQVLPAGNPSGSFFFMLTAIHGLHVLGGLAGLSAAWFSARDGVAAGWRVRLCARYWHFLLAVWLVLLAVLGWLTPEIVRAICGTA